MAASTPTMLLATTIVVPPTTLAMRSALIRWSLTTLLALAAALLRIWDLAV